MTRLHLRSRGRRPGHAYQDGRACNRCSRIRRRRLADHILCAYYGGEFLYTQRIAITDRFKYVFNGFDIDECYDLRTIAGDAEPGVERDKRPTWTICARLYELMTSSTTLSAI